MNTFLLVNKDKKCGTLQTDKDFGEVRMIYDADKIYPMNDIKERHEMVIQCGFDEVGHDYFYK